MTLREYTTEELDLCLIPRWSVEHVTRRMDIPDSYFEGVQGNTVFVPVFNLPLMERAEYKQVAGTRIDGYSPDLDVFLWQFGRNWMGHPGENYTLLAAPKEDVFYALQGTLYLVESFDDMGTRLPDDCNVHWRSFSTHQEEAFQSLLRFLRHTDIVVPTPTSTLAQSFLKTHALPAIHADLPGGSYGRGDCLLKIEQSPDQKVTIRLATVFSMLYGIDFDGDD